MDFLKQGLTIFLVCLLTPGGVWAEGTPWWQNPGKPYSAPRHIPLHLENSPRLDKLLRAGNLYLTLEDAIALAIENNLDVEIQRYTFALADSEVTRARGGGLLRGLGYSVAEITSGVGGPTSQLLTTSNRVIPGTSVSTNPFEVGALGVIQTNLSITGATPLSNGTNVPVFDPFVSGRLNYSHQSNPQTNVAIAGTENLITDSANAGAGYRQGFGSGASLSASFDNQRQLTNSIRSSLSPYTASSLGITATQPLLRGFGFQVNRRFQRIAENEQKIADLLFRQQLIATVYGVSRLFHDYVALYDDLKVKEESLTLAQKLFDDTKAQVDEGTLAAVEFARANAQVFSTKLDLEHSRGLQEEQEVILKSVLTKRGTEDPAVRAAHIIPIAPGTPAGAELPDSEQLIQKALGNRPDLELATLQISNSELALIGSRNAIRPQVDLVGFMQNNALAGQVNSVAPVPDLSFVGGYGSALAQIFRRNYPVYGGGIQIDLPVRNRVAQADLARDEVQVRQTRVREQQLRNQVRLEVEDALIALRRAKASFDAAAQARLYQEESLKAEQAKFEVGASTSSLVIQFQTFLTQARSSEVAARSSYIKAQAALQRSTGSILADYGVSIAAARQGAL